MWKHAEQGQTFRHCWSGASLMIIVFVLHAVVEGTRAARQRNAHTLRRTPHHSLASFQKSGTCAATVRGIAVGLQRLCEGHGLGQWAPSCNVLCLWLRLEFVLLRPCLLMLPLLRVSPALPSTWASLIAHVISRAIARHHGCYNHCSSRLVRLSTGTAGMTIRSGVPGADTWTLLA